MYKATQSYGSKEHVFSQVPEAQIPRSVFNRSHTVKTTLNENYIIPFYVDEALPGDTFNLNATLFARMSTPIAPIMDNLYIDVFYFAVPIRLVWANFKYFMGEKVNPGDSTSYDVPCITCPEGGWLEETLSDYLGLPIKVSGITGVSSLWHRAYNLIYNEWFRDQNLINSVTVPTDDNDDPDTDFVLLKRCKRHDYFTSALPWLQKGTAVSIPLGTSAPVLGNGADINVYNNADATLRVVRLEAGSGAIDVGAPPSSSGYMRFSASTTPGSTSGLYTDLSTATAATINSLRQAFQLQKLMERDARGGTRYTEIVKAHFGVTSPDARLQRPEYLGGGTTPIVIQPVPQMSSTTGNYAQGHLAGFGVGVEPSVGFTKSFTEHCLLLGLVSIRADMTYQQGVNKMFLRSTRYDFYWPALATIGEQAILNKEIYAQGTGDDANTFGYQERYAEYRYKPSMITGKLRSTATTPLDVWHLAQKFTSLPTLSQTFIEEAVPMARVSAVESEPHFIMDAFINIKAARPMPVYGVPGLIDHF